jgi:DNA repair exonuclease SbcCD nuclease subunit
MSNLFKKVACFTDIHFGMRQNSRSHNQDCENFINWFCETAKAQGCETCIFLGDWHHHRATVNVSTLNYTVSNLETLSKNFEKVYFISGNHDLYYREKREINSLPFARTIDNIIMVNDIMSLGDVTLVPWLVEEEWKEMKKLKSKYVFGHFELPNFYMNAMVQMPDHGGLNNEHFPNQEYVFSGHFHKRQSNKNVHYIGNAFPHNFADAWDDERGMMILEWGAKPEYITWPNQPTFKTLNLSQLIEAPEKFLDANTFARVTIDIDISYEEANFLKETFLETYKVREINFIPSKKEEHSQDWDGGEILFESVDTIVLNQLTAIDSEVIDKQMLVDIYNSLA